MVLYFSITITIIFIFFAFYFCHHSNNFFDQNFHFFYPQIFLTKKQTMPVEKLNFFDDFNFFHNVLHANSNTHFECEKNTFYEKCEHFVHIYEYDFHSENNQNIGIPKKNIEKTVLM